jgi:hypothetical protein
VFRETVLAIVRERYADFGPTLAAEKLSELHGLDLGVETLRQRMIGAGIWVRRYRRVCLRAERDIQATVWAECDAHIQDHYVERQAICPGQLDEGLVRREVLFEVRWQPLEQRGYLRWYSGLARP